MLETMRSSIVHRRLVSLVAAFAFLMGAVAPAISAMLGPQRAVAMLEVCTAEGTVLVHAHSGLDGRQPSPPAGHGFDHCPYCGSQATPLHPPPAPAAALPVPGLTEARPAAFLFAPSTPHAWTSAQPRAPPSLS